MENEDPVINEFGISRRELMRRGAIAGTLVWAAPVVRTFATPAFATTGSPGKDFSYIAICYTCGTDPTEYCVKWELDDDGNVTATETGSFELPGCSPSSTTGGDGDPSLFTVSSPDGGLTMVVCYVGGEECDINWSLGVGKCGAPDNEASGGECVQGTQDGDCLTFSMCGV